MKTMRIEFDVDKMEPEEVQALSKALQLGIVHWLQDNNLVDAKIANFKIFLTEAT